MYLFSSNTLQGSQGLPITLQLDFWFFTQAKHVSNLLVIPSYPPLSPFIQSTYLRTQLQCLLLQKPSQLFSPIQSINTALNHNYLALVYVCLITNSFCFLNYKVNLTAEAIVSFPYTNLKGTIIGSTLRHKILCWWEVNREAFKITLGDPSKN